MMVVPALLWTAFRSLPFRSPLNLSESRIRDGIKIYRVISGNLCWPVDPVFFRVKLKATDLRCGGDRNSPSAGGVTNRFRARAVKVTDRRRRRKRHVTRTARNDPFQAHLLLITKCTVVVLVLLLTGKTSGKLEKP
jgi:hypothetical protein